VALASGTRLGPYEITASIGAGGMGEVYRATDTRLKRPVAIKVLPESVAGDAERLARFQREAEVLAQLNHPNIAQIYGIEEGPAVPDAGRVGEAGRSVHALVMELVEGPTLADRIAQGAIPVAEALAIAKQIAEALEAAHEQGIIHRDLKPANIKVRPDGTVKVLDFGLAKAMEPAGAAPANVSQLPTITTPAMMTGAGIILGTAAYMSPEQAKGRAVDARTDVWAFGAVLYEMLSGRRAFDGEDTTDVLGAVVRLDPDWDKLPSEMPAHVRQVIRACLQKNLKQRLTSIQDVRLALSGAFVQDTPQPAGTVVQPPTPLWRRAIVPATTMLLGAIAAAIAVWFAIQPVPPHVARFSITGAGPMTPTISGFGRDLALTPDGTGVVYIGGNATQLLLRARDRIEPRVLAKGAAFRNVFTSPDGQWVGFFDNVTTLKKVAITGGQAITVAVADGNGARGATWGKDGSIVYATNATSTGLQRIADAGGEPTVLTMPDPERGESDHLWPEYLPDGQRVLFTITSRGGGLAEAQVAVLDLRTGVYETVLPGAYHAQYVPTGHLVYGAEGGLRATAFDWRRIAVLGTAVPVLEEVFTTAEGGVDAVVANDGTLAYITGSEAESRFTWVDRAGTIQGAVGERVTNLRNFTLAPDEGRLAFQTLVPATVWIADLRRAVTSRLASGGDPVWSPDGGRVAVNRNDASSGRVFAVPAAGGDERLLWQAEQGLAYVEDWHPDGDRLAVLLVQPGLDRGAVVSTTDGKAVIFDEARDLDEPHFSPDGKWVAYNADRDGGGVEVFVVPFPSTGARFQVSTGGGFQARWRGDGRELFYLTPAGTMMAVDVDARGGLKLGVPRPLFETGLANLAPNVDQYAVTRDGQRFLLAVPADPQGGRNGAQIVVVENWFEELKRLVPAD
jgi:serine/threonine-protein kinase